MRICILTHTFPRFEGDTISSIFMSELAQSMSDAGNKVWVVTPWTPLFKKQKKDYKIETYKYIYPNWLHKLGYSETLSNDMKLPFLMWVLSPFMYFFSFLKLLDLVKREKIEVINAHWILPNGFIASAVSLFTGVPVVSTLPGSDVYMAKKNLLFNILARFATWKSKWITSNSPQLIFDLEDATKISLLNKNSTIAYGIGSNKFKPDSSLGLKTRTYLGFKKPDIVVLGVGRLVEKKGFEYLIKASKELVSNSKNLYFVLIGDGEQKESLQNLTQKLGVANNFRFLGNISYTKMSAYYNMADIFILPSIRDKKGNLDDQSVAVMDAMSCGKPVVTTDFPGYRQVITNGKDGLLVKEKDSKGIARILKKLIEDKKLRSRVGESGRKKILSEFGWKNIGLKYTDLFNKIVNNSYSLGVPKIMNESGRLKIAKQIWGVLKNNVNNPGNLKLLDIACSNGIITNYLSGYFENCTGVDLDQQALLYAKNKFVKKNLLFEVGDAQNLKYKNNSFDVCVCNQVYNFVDNPQKLVDEIYRVLKPGGVCFFGARNRFTLMEPQYNIPFGSWFPKLLPFGKNYMSYWSLNKLLQKFEVNDLTLEIIKSPRKFGYLNLEKYSKLAKVLPLNLLRPFLPNYIFVIRKTKVV